MHYKLGIIFSIWDYLFGTQYKGYEEYPDSGIEDQSFPVETTTKGLNLIRTPLVQLIYPFKVIVKSIRKRIIK